MSVDIRVKAYYNDFLREARAFDEKLPQLLEQYPSEYVAVFEGEVIGHSKSWEELAEKMHERVPNRFVLLEKVEAKSSSPALMEAVEG